MGFNALNDLLNASHQLREVHLGRTGLEVSEHLLKLRPGLPVLIYTGYTDSITQDTVKRHGIRALIRKPVDTEQLHGLAQQLLAAQSQSRH